MGGVGHGCFKAGRRDFLALENDERRQMLARQGNAVNENAERTMRSIPVAFLPVAEKARQQGCGFGTCFFGKRFQRYAEKAGDVETRTRREGGRRHQLYEKRKDRQMAT